MLLTDHAVDVNNHAALFASITDHAVNVNNHVALYAFSLQYKH